MKSVTCAACSRSIRLPMAPPMMKASGIAVRQSRRGVRRSHTTSTALITTARATKNQRCQPAPSARKLNAAPLLNASVQFRKPGITACGMPIGCSACTAHHLLSWSSAMTVTESHSQVSALGFDDMDAGTQSYGGYRLLPLQSRGRLGGGSLLILQNQIKSLPHPSLPCLAGEGDMLEVSRIRTSDDPRRSLRCC